MELRITDEQRDELYAAFGMSCVLTNTARLRLREILQSLPELPEANMPRGHLAVRAAMLGCRFTAHEANDIITSVLVATQEDCGWQYRPVPSPWKPQRSEVCVFYDYPTQERVVFAKYWETQRNRNNTYNHRTAYGTTYRYVCRIPKNTPITGETISAQYWSKHGEHYTVEANDAVQV